VIATNTTTTKAAVTETFNSKYLWNVTMFLECCRVDGEVGVGSVTGEPCIYTVVAMAWAIFQCPMVSQATAETGGWVDHWFLETNGLAPDQPGLDMDCNYGLLVFSATSSWFHENHMRIRLLVWISSNRADLDGWSIIILACCCMCPAPFFLLIWQCQSSH
jgi:hypothetical protein